MGNAQSLSPPTSNAKFNKLQHNENQMIITVDIHSESSDLTPWIAINEYRKNTFAHPQSFQPQFIRVIHDGICNDQCQALFKAEKFVDTLYDEIEKRKNIGRYYSHEQVWYVFLILTRLAASIHSKGSKWMVGNIHPKNILLNAHGQIKIVTANSLPYEKDHFLTYKQQGIHSAYLSPELLGFSFEKQFTQFPHCINRQLSETFTIAVTMLSITHLLTDLSFVYDTTFFCKSPNQSKNSKFIAPGSRNTSIKSSHTLSGLLNVREIDRMIKTIHQKYCPLLAIALKGMLHPDPSERISASSIYKELLQPNQGFILGMELEWLGTTELRQLTQEDYSQIFSEHNQRDESKIL